MKFSNLEKHITRLFKNHKAPLDTNELWGNIENRIAKKKRKRRFFIIIFLGIGLAGWLTYSFLNTTNNKISPDALNIENTAKEDQAKPALTEEQKAFNTNTEKQNSITTSTEKTEAPKLVTIPENPGKAKVKAVRNDFSETIKSHQIALETEAGEFVLNDEKNLKSFNFGYPAELLRSKYPGSIYLMSSPYPIGLEVQRNSAKKRKAKKLKRKRRSAGWTKSFDFYLSPELAFRHMSPNLLLVDNIQYVRDRKATEKTLEAFSAGFDFKLMNRHGFILLSGLDIKQINERLEFNETTEEVRDVNGLLTITMNALGDTTQTTSGLVDGIVITRREKVSYNHYRSYNIPIGIGYQFQQRNFELELSGGVDINIGVHRKGEILNASGNFRTISSRNAFSRSLYKSTTGLSIWTGTNVVKSYKKLSIFGGPYLRYSLKSMTKNDSAVSHKYTTLGLRIGARVYVD